MNIGDQVSKISGKPFKSRRKVNTVKNIVPRPTGGFAFTFHEDDSIVDTRVCKPASAAEIALNERHNGPTSSKTAL